MKKQIVLAGKSLHPVAVTMPPDPRSAPKFGPDGFHMLVAALVLECAELREEIRTLKGRRIDA